MLAPILWLAGGIELAYPLVKLVNAALFALAAVPVYLLARRLLSPWWSVGVAALSVAIPSSIYTSLVLTESAAYLASSLALLAVVLALERPTVIRQLAMLGAIGVAYAIRPQFAALVGAFLLGALLSWAVAERRPPLGDLARRLWPTLAAVLLAGAAFGTRLLLDRSTPEDDLGGYGDLWRGYDLVSLARLAVYHLAGWEIYLFVVPFVVAPIVVVQLLRGARRGDARDAAFVSAFLTVNTFFVLVAAAFASTPYGYSELHDRYLFYIAPLWLVAFGVWLSSGLPRPLTWTAVGAGLALVLPAILPFGLVGGNLVLEAVPTATWSWVWTVVEGTPHLDGRRVLGMSVVLLTLVAVVLPRRLWPVLPILVAAGLGLNTVLAWERVADAPVAFELADADERTWVDDAVPDGSRVTTLYVSPLECPYSELTRHAFFLTEFFNPSVHRVVTTPDSGGDGLPVGQVEVYSAGRLVHADGEPLVADYVVTQPEIVLAGRRIARDTGADLVLWETGGAVRLAAAAARGDDLPLADCG